MSDKNASIASAVKKFMKSPRGGWWKLPAVGLGGYAALKGLSGAAGGVSNMFGGGSNAAPPEVTYSPEEINQLERQDLLDQYGANSFAKNWQDTDERLSQQYWDNEASKAQNYDNTVKEMENYGWELGDYAGPVPHPGVGLPKQSSAAPILSEVFKSAGTFSPTDLNAKLEKDKGLKASAVKAVEDYE